MAGPQSIPQYPTGGTAQPVGLPGPTMSGPPGPNDLGARQVQGAAGAAEDLINEQVMLQNQVRVNDAMNQVRQKALDLTYDPQGGFLSQTGYNALSRQSGQSLPQEYGGKLQQAISDIGSGLTPQQQRVFQMQAQPVATSFVGDVANHWRQQSRAYALSVQDNTVKLAGDQAAQHWNDPTAINGGVDADGNQVPGLIQQAQAAVYASGKLTGMDVQAAMLEAGSSIHSKVIESALENGDPLYATKYLQAHSSQMTADDILRVQGRVNQNADAQIAILATERARQQFQPAAAPTNTDRLVNLLVPQAESGGKDFNSDGTPVTSRTGALYAMQVEPSTARDPGFGITPADESGTPQQKAAEYNRVGRQYLQALLQKYGNVPQAVAAYNAGPGAVDKAIADTKSVGEPTLWLQALPKETQAYVASISKAYDAGQGAPALPTKQAFLDAAEAALGPNPRPSALMITRQRAEAQYTLMMQARDEQGDQALRAVQQALVANGGDYAAVQRDNPDLITSLAAASPGKVDDAMRFAKAIARGENVDNLSAYGQAVSHPEELAKLTDAQMDQFVRTNFSTHTAEMLWKMRQEFVDGKVDQSAGALNLAALNEAANTRLLNIGLNPDPKTSNVSDRARIGNVKQYLIDGIMGQQQQLGRKMTAAEVTQFVDQQFQRNQVLPHWYGDSTKPAMSMQYGDVPSDVRAAIDQRMPGASDGDKLRAYWTWKGRNGAASGG